MEFWGDFFKTFLEGSVEHIIYRDYVVNRRFFIYCSLASHHTRHHFYLSVRSQIEAADLLAQTSGRVPRRGWQAPCGMSMSCDRRESDRKLSQPGVAKPRVRDSYSACENDSIFLPVKCSASQTKPMLPTRKSVPRSSRESGHTKIS